MVNQQLVDYIRTQEAQGYTQQQLRDSLIQQGYNPIDVHEAIEAAAKPAEAQQPENKPKKGVSLGVTLIALTFLINGGSLVFKNAGNLIRGAPNIAAESSINIVTALIGGIYSAFFVAFSILWLVVGTIFLLTSLGLWLQKKWGRILAIISSILMMSFIITIPVSIIFLVVLFNRNVKKQFA